MPNGKEILPEMQNQTSVQKSLLKQAVEKKSAWIMEIEHISAVIKKSNELYAVLSLDSVKSRRNKAKANIKEAIEPYRIAQMYVFQFLYFNM